MNTKDALRSSMDMSLFVLTTYVSDFTDEELLERPTKACNPLAWQLGHLISSEVNLLESICPGQGGELPDGFADAHSKEAAQSDDTANYRKKEEYLSLFETVRSATKAALEALPDEDLDKPSPEWIREQFPTQGDMFTLIGTHPMMHAGQFAVVRRSLGKPILM